MVSTHGKLRELVGDLWNKYTRHEFVERLRNGSLPMDVFRYYLIQDTKYVREMQKAVIEAASKAPLNEAIDVLTAVFSNVERGGAEVHERLFRDLSITEEEVNNTGFNLVNYAYIRHLHYYASLGWPQFLAAWAPCMGGVTTRLVSMLLVLATPYSMHGPSSTYRAITGLGLRSS
ncbi:hypothetical protein [Vulcanisaeta distributa]|uniref:hypothetical protein n=1 Tax=Vulcanisaeta distributa TaxID=164451 RepID=UPI000A53EA2C|nr:hypothetical protein [Vulcanisaeta distributa]